MKEIGKWLAFSSCIAGAVYLIVNGKDGWGWLLFLAFCII